MPRVAGIFPNDPGHKLASELTLASAPEISNFTLAPSDPQPETPKDYLQVLAELPPEIRTLIISTGRDIDEDTIRLIESSEMPDEVVEIILAISRGVPPTITSLFRSLRRSWYSYPQVADELDRGFTVRFHSRSAAIRACRLHSTYAFLILGAERMKRDTQSCLVDVGVVSERYHRLYEQISQKLDAMRDMGDAEGFSKLTAQAREVLRDLANLSGRPVIDTKRITGDHRHLVAQVPSEKAPATAYGSWAGGTTDLGALPGTAGEGEGPIDAEWQANEGGGV